MQTKDLLLLLFLFCFACRETRQEESDSTNQGTKTEMAFDETKWKTKKGRDYPYRDSMIEDLISNEKLRKFKKDEVLDLLGEPDRINDGYLYYMIAQKRLGFWPLHTKTLVIKLSEDSTIDWIKIHE